MNIKVIDIDSLVCRLNTDAIVSESDVDIANRILFGFDNISSPQGDVVFVPGNPTCVEDRIVKAVDLIQNGIASTIVLSGGVLIPNSELTEAEAMKKYCLSAGLDDSQMIIENKSTITHENIIYSAPLINSLSFDCTRIIAVTSATHMRRVLMNFDKYRSLYSNGTSIVAHQSIHLSCDPSNWYENLSTRKIVATEISIIKNYIYNDGYTDFDF